MFNTISSSFISYFLILELIYHQGAIQPCCAQSETLRLSEKKCHEYQAYVYEKSYSIPLIAGGERVQKPIKKCGFESIELIIGGEDAKPLEFPHMALIGYTPRNEKLWKCGGSLISEKFVLTAAHCKKTPFGEPTFVRLGELNIKATDDEANPEDFNVQQIIVHPNYKNKLKINDIALIQLARNVKFDKYKRPACLPVSHDWPQKRALATGWGLNSTYETDGTSHLQKVVIEKFPESVCKSKYSTYPITYREQVCLGSNNEERDTCQGDSGGPLQVLHPKEDCMWQIVGITSFGGVCGSIGIPGVYVRVYPYIDWIEDKVWSADKQNDNRFIF